jgi:ABC-type sugar transport system substrate-binding protein
VAFADFRTADGGVGPLRSAVEAALGHGVDAIGLWCLHPEVLERPVKSAQAAGVPVLTLERPPFAVDASVPFPNFQHGMYMVDYLTTVLDAGARVGVIGGPPISDDDELVAGFLYAFERADLTILNDPTIDRYRNKTDVATGGREAALRLLEDIAEMDALIAYNDETMLGTLQALEETGRLGEMLVISRNGTPEAVRQILLGRTHGTWDPDAPGIGVTLGDLIVRRLVDGVDLEGQIVISPVGRMIEPGNAARWVSYEERFPYRELRNGLD